MFRNSLTKFELVKHQICPGILSVFCAQAGAKNVYAVEATNLAILVSQVSVENHVEDKIRVIQKKVEDISPDDIDKVDIIVSEWMGFYLVHEGMLDSVIVARDKFLKPGGLMFPSVAKIYAAPCQLPNYFEFWDDILGVSMKWVHFCIKTITLLHYLLLTSVLLSRSVAECYRNTKSLRPEILLIPKEDILAEGKLLVWLDLTTTTLVELNCFGGEETVLTCCKNGKYQGFGIWFDVEFPDGSMLSTAPTAEPTHWKQTVIVLPTSIEVNENEPVAFQLKLDKNSSNSRMYNISFIMLDPSNIPHDIPCDCYMTKCIVTKTYIENQRIEINTEEK